MFKFRVIGFILLLALLGGIFFWRAGGFWLFLAAAPAMCAAAVGECCLMLKRSGRSAYPLPAAFLSWAVLVLTIALPSARLSFGFLFFLLTALLVATCFAGLIGILLMRPRLMEGIFTTLGVAGMLTWSLGLFLLTYGFDGRAGYWLFFLCLVTKATDTGGYIVGTLTAKLPGGNHKIAPTVSPKKSWEGLVGGFLLSLAVAWAFYRFGNAHVAPFGEPPLWWYLTAGAVLSIGSFFGDLTESAIKRMCGVKDSGGFVPGMGGAFDVLDSFLYNGMLFWWLFGIRAFF